MPTRLIIGDDFNRQVQLKKDGVEFDMAGATVQAAIVSEDRATVLIDPVSCAEGATGAVWASSLVVVAFTEAATAEVTEGLCYLEIQVDDSGKNTWFVALNAITGNIP